MGKEIAAKVEVKAAEIDKVIKEIVAKGITKAKEIIHAIIDHFFPHLELADMAELENVVTCEDVLSKEVCDSLREAAKKLKLKVQVIDQIIREAIKEKITKKKKKKKKKKKS